MPESQPNKPASAASSIEAGELFVNLAGSWRLTDPTPRWKALRTKERFHVVRCSVKDIEAWDSSLILYLHALLGWCRSHKLAFPADSLPADMAGLLQQMDARGPASVPKDRSQDLLSFIGVQAVDLWEQGSQISHFVGECVIAIGRLAREPAKFRWRDCLAEMQQCGAMALPIVSLVSFLVGVTLAYTGAIVLRLFGGDIWIADMIGLSVTREMAAVMTGVVLAGRTGAAYAAHLGNMKANEEIDALSTLGVSPVDFLVIPRMLALALMTPLLTLYANLLGILGGMLIAMAILSIPPSAYWVEMLTIVDLSDVMSGLIKASAFGIIVGMAGCLRGLQADRSAQGVGKAATSAVVTAILLMVVADALFAVIFNAIGL